MDRANVRLKPVLGHRELMRLHLEALFTHDAGGRLVAVNEPGGGPAPRFFIGRTADGTVLRFRHDLEGGLRRELEMAAGDDSPSPAPRDTPLDPLPYARILDRGARVERTWAGPAFSFPVELPARDGAVLVTAGNAQLLRRHLEAWEPDVPVCRPMAVVTVDGHAVTVCCSVRRTDAAHEAGVETAQAWRGRGHAAIAVAAWAAAVREMGRVPLYSTSWQNEPSLAVARKLGLIAFGSDVHIT